MTTDFRALCDELVCELSNYKVAFPNHETALLDRARTALAQPASPAEGEAADEELDVLERKSWKVGSSIEIEPEGIREVLDREETFDHRAFARAAIALDRSRRAPVQPVAVSEGLPAETQWVHHCYTGVRDWMYGIYSQGKFYQGAGPESFPATHWHPALPLPTPTTPPEAP